MIRFAKPEDGSAVMPILNQIFEEMEIEQLQDVPQADLFQTLETLFLTEDYRYSYRRTLLQTDTNGVIQGLAVSYPETDEAEIDAPLRPYLSQLGLTADQALFPDKESYPGEWYLDALAVAPKYQGQGIGSQLLAALKTQVPNGYDYLSLNVDFANPGAKRLYERSGFEVSGTLMIGSHQYEHMRYALNA